MTHVTSAHDNELPRIPSIPLTDEQALNGDGNQSIGHLVKDATTHLSTLLRAEIELAKAEVASEVKKGLTGSIFFIVALVIGLGSLPYPFIAAALGLNEALPAWAEPWGGFLIMFIVMLLLAGMFVFLGVRKVKRVRAPERTISSIRQTAAAITHRGGEDATPGTAVSVDVSGTAVRPS
jgi:Putative Actinobacterial Holin-X, holin superfamily III